MNGPSLQILRGQDYTNGDLQKVNGVDDDDGDDGDCVVGDDDDDDDDDYVAEFVLLELSKVE